MEAIDIQVPSGDGACKPEDGTTDDQRNASHPWHQQQHGNLQHQSINKQHDIAGKFL
jgi:hypothetical protein